MTEIPDVKLRALANFPVAVTGRTAINVVKVNGHYYIDYDVSGIVQNTNIPADQVDQYWFTIWNEQLNSYVNVPYSLAVTAGVASLEGKTGALDIGDGLQFAGDTLEIDPAIRKSAVFETRADFATTPIDPTIKTVIVNRRATGQPVSLAYYERGLIGDVDALHNTADGEYWKHVTSLPVSVLHFGSVGAADDGPTINAAIAAFPATGGELVMPSDNFTFSTPIDMDGRRNIRVVGQGSMTAGADAGTVLTFTGTGSGDAISMGGTATGCGFSNVKISYNSSSFTGHLINIGSGAKSIVNADHLFHNCVVADDSGANTATLVYLGNGSQAVTFEKVTFNGGKPSVLGKNVADEDHFANVISFRDCVFLNHSGPAVKFGGESWTFDICAFEPSITGAPIAYVGDAVVPAIGMEFRNCWMGDVTAPGVWITYYGTGLVVTGGRITADHTGSQYGIALEGAVGWVVECVEFEGLAAAISFDNTAVDAGGMRHCKLVSCDNGIINIANRGPSVVCYGNTPRTELDPCFGSATWDPPNLASGAQQTTTVVVGSAAIGDKVEVSFSNASLATTMLVGNVSASDTVTVVHFNNSGVAVNGTSGTLRAMVTKW